MLDIRLSGSKYPVAVMLDRDGTINVDHGYTNGSDKVEFVEGAIEGLQVLSSLRIHIIIITNQSGIALGLYDLVAMKEYNRRLVETISKEGGRIDAIYYSPNHDLNSLPLGMSLSHQSKPNPGMLEEAQADFFLDMRHSWMVGDRISDIVAGKRAGSRAILLNSSNLILPNVNDTGKPDFIFSSLVEASLYIKRMYPFWGRDSDVPVLGAR